MKYLLVWIKSLFFLSLTISSKAGIITVNSNGGGLGTNELCSLRAAIRAAESDVPFSACIAGSGDDIIILPANETITLHQIDNDTIGENALPRITTNITIEGNHATITMASSAPMMRFFDVGSVNGGVTAHLTLNNLTLKNGDVDGSGGAIRNDGILYLNHVRLENNRASFEGGALTCFESQAECYLNSSILLGNSASYGGAIIVDLGANLVLDKTTIFGNQATIDNGAADGGSIYVESGNALITNSTIANNQAGRYGGLLATSSDLPFTTPGRIELSYSTVVNNSLIGLIGNIEVNNSIISNNVGGNCRSSNSVQSGGYNHSDDDNCGFNMTGDVENLNAHLSALQTVDQYTFAYPLGYQSLAIDAADPNNCIGTDQISQVRPMDGDNDGILRCDKGAFEMINNIIFLDGFE